MERLTSNNGQLYACGNNLCEDGMGCEECRYREEAERKLAAYEDAEEQNRLIILPYPTKRHYLQSGSSKTMMRKKVKCDVCGVRLKPKRERTITVKRNALYAYTYIYYDVMDCPKCGCEITLCSRYTKPLDTLRAENLEW